MKNKMKVFASMIAFCAFTVFAASAQHSTDYAYQNPNGAVTTYQNQNGTYNRPNPNGYGNSRDARYKTRAYYANSQELQRLYQTEDALYQRYQADLTLGDRRAARIDKEKLEDVQEHILKEEARYARLNPNYRNNSRDRRPDHDRDGDRRR